MARRKKSQFLDDGSSSSSNDSGDDQDDLANQEMTYDERAEQSLFENPYQRPARGTKRSRDERKDDAVYGVFGEDDDEGRAGGGRGKGNAKGERGSDRWRNLAKTPNFVSAGSNPSTSSRKDQPLDNLADAFAPKQRIQAAKEDEEDLEMDMSSDEDVAGRDELDREGAANDQDEANDSDDDGDEDEDGDEQGSDDEEYDEGDLAPVPGLADETRPTEAPPPPIETPQASLAFAPRGIGSARTGIGGRGIGARVSASTASPSRRGIGFSFSAPSFASATSASSMPLGGLGAAPSTSGAESPMAGASTSRAGLGSSRIGGSNGREASPGGAYGFGARPSSTLVDSLRSELASSSTSISASNESSRDASPAPNSGQPTRERRSFLPTTTTTPSTSTNGARPAVPKISKREQQHFAQLASSGSLGMKMLERMGWTAGSGLGVDGQGIVTPIGEGQKVRKDRSGITRNERSEGAKADERRRKGIASDEEDEDGKGPGKKGKGKAKHQEDKKENVREAWTRPESKRKEAKVKTEYKTYEQLVAESGADAEDGGVGMLVDLAGNALPSHSLSSLPAFGAGSADPTRLPELRHNLTVLTSTLSANLSALAREGKTVEDRRSYLSHEESRVQSVVQKQELAIERVRAVLQVVGRVKKIEADTLDLAKASSSGFVVGATHDLGPNELLSPFNDVFDELLGNFSEEYTELKLDEVVVSAIAPLCRRLFQDWDPLSSPSFAVAELKRWKRHFLIDKQTALDLSNVDQEVDVFGAASRATYGKGASSKGDRFMSAYETMMWSIWLPRVRTAINNQWSAIDPTPVVNLYNAWHSLLPQFLRDNILDQLVFPKLLKTIQDWTPSAVLKGTSAPLHRITFPWLEIAGDQRIEFIMDEAKRRVRAWLKGWKTSDGLPGDLGVWKDAYASVDWDGLMLKHVLPPLGSTLRDKFIINPRSQDLKPLDLVLSWSPLLRSSMMSQLLEAEFVPKWLDALYIWLTSTPNLEQVAEWYSWWKAYLPEEIVALSGISRGFKKGLDLMNQAMALGDDAKYRLKRPDLTPAPSKKSSSSLPKQKTKSTQYVVADNADEEEISFRSIVEEVAASNNLVFLSTGRSDDHGRTLFRVSKGIDGKSGVTVYLEDDVVWILEKNGEWMPIAVEEMCQRASGD